MVGVWTFDPVKLQSWKPWSSATAPRIPKPLSGGAPQQPPTSKRGWGVQGSAPMKRMCGLSAAAPAAPPAAAQRPGSRSIAAEARISGCGCSPHSPELGPGPRAASSLARIFRRSESNSRAGPARAAAALAFVARYGSPSCRSADLARCVAPHAFIAVLNRRLFIEPSTEQTITRPWWWLWLLWWSCRPPSKSRSSSSCSAPPRPGAPLPRPPRPRA